MPLTELLIEVDRESGSSAYLTHPGGGSPRHPDLEHRRNLYAATLSLACNFGSTRMAELTGISADTIDWTIRWYLREDTLRAANAAIVNAHHRHPLAAAQVGGTLSSSDGPRMPMRGKSLTGRALSRYFMHEGLTSYTHISDQYSTFGTQIVVTIFSSPSGRCLHIQHRGIPRSGDGDLYSRLFTKLTSSTARATMAFWALNTLAAVDGRVGWAVIDGDYEVQPQSAAYLYAMRSAGDRAEGTCRTYAHHLSLFFTWLAETNRDWRRVGADDLASFVLWLERTPSRLGPPRSKRPDPDS